MPRRELKRPYNHPLSTDDCNCQASEEERLNVKRRGSRPRIDGDTLAMQPYMKLTLPDARRGAACIVKTTCGFSS